MNQLHLTQSLHRRTFLSRTGLGLGAIALNSLLEPQVASASVPAGLPDHPPTAKRVVYLFQSGAPSQFELFDYKPELRSMHKQELPDSVRMGQRLTGMTSGQQSLPITASMFGFKQHGQCGMWLGDLIPNIATLADDICVLRTLHTEAIHHDPAITFCQTGSQRTGRPRIGAWVAYGLGSLNADLPTFMVLISCGSCSCTTMGRPTTSAKTSSNVRCTCTISMRRSCTAWGSITIAWP